MLNGDNQNGCEEASPQSSGNSPRSTPPQEEGCNSVDKLEAPRCLTWAQNMPAQQENVNSVLNNPSSEAFRPRET